MEKTMEWEPIKTAPRVGEFLVWTVAGDVAVVYADIFMDCEDGSREYFNGDVFVTPTHWMPLPRPPSDKGET
jgi:hypothetical protein